MQARSPLRVLAATLVAVLPCLADEPSVSLVRLDLDRSAPGMGEVRALAAAGVHFIRLNAVELDNRGRIVVLGAVLADADPSPAEFGAPALARLLPGGALDASFGDDGIAVLPIDGRAWALAVDAQDRALVAGSFTRGLASAEATLYVAARFTADGRPDADFGEAGLAPPPAGLHRATFVVADASDSSLLFMSDRLRFEIGRVFQDTFLVRLRPSGAPDLDWGTAGVAPAGFAAVDAVIADDGGVFASDHSGVVRFSPDGKRDVRFGDLGALVTAAGRRVGAGSMETDAAGRLVLLGSDGSNGGFFRFFTDGTPDASFGDGGFARSRSGSPSDSEGAGPRSMAIARGGPERYVTAMGLRYATPDFGTTTGSGHVVNAFDPARPSLVASHFTELPGGSEQKEFLFDVAVAADGKTAIAVGFAEAGGGLPNSPLLLRVDLTRETPLPLANLTIAWTGPLKTQRRRFRIEIEGTLRVTNTSGVAVANARVSFLLSRDDELDDGDGLFDSAVTGPVGPGETVTVPVRLLIGRNALPRRGRLVAVIDREGRVIQSDEPDDVAVSRRLR